MLLIYSSNIQTKKHSSLSNFILRHETNTLFHIRYSGRGTIAQVYCIRNLKTVVLLWEINISKKADMKVRSSASTKMSSKNLKNVILDCVLNLFLSTFLALFLFFYYLVYLVVCKYNFLNWCLNSSTSIITMNFNNNGFFLLKFVLKTFCPNGKVP